jgi:hypothetical protein
VWREAVGAQDADDALGGLVVALAGVDEVQGLEQGIVGAEGLDLDQAPAW